MKNIKNKILYITIMVLVAIIITMSVVVTNNFHSRVAMITEIDEENNLITTTCGNGNMFAFYSATEDWAVGDLCSLIMFDNGTEIVYDDIVVSARYGGFIELFEEIEKR